MTYYVELRYKAAYNYIHVIEYHKWRLGADDMGVMLNKNYLTSYFNGEVLKIGIL
jgi:hypothetical protein